MRAMVVEADTLSAFRMSESLTTAGFATVVHARSSGEALLLARAQTPDIVVLRASLETGDVSQRLADTLERELRIPAILTNEPAHLHERAQGSELIQVALSWRKQRKN